MTERAIQRARQNLDVKRILGEMIRDGEVESDIGRKTTLYRLTHDTCIKNTEKYAHVSCVMESNAPENDISAPDVIEGFREYGNPEPPVLRCPNCVHHRPENYPDGLCAAGYCQMNLPCHDHKEITKTEKIAS
jgi:hypothetical protein